MRAATRERTISIIARAGGSVAGFHNRAASEFGRCQPKNEHSLRRNPR